MLKSISCAAAAPTTIRLLSLALGFAFVMACANANVTGDTSSNPNHTHGGGQNVPLGTGDGNKPVTLPVDGNGLPMVGNIGLRYIGRANSGNVLSWSGSALELYFSGTDAAFSFQAPTTPANFLGITVDGAEQGNVQVSTGQPVVIGPLADSNHIVRLTKLSEAKLGELGLQSWNANGRLNVPKFASRRIEVIGDSIASAYGIEGTDPNCVNSSATENALVAFPALLGNVFSADVSVVSYSGRGVLRNDVSDDPNAPKPVVPALWTRTTATSGNNTYAYSPGQTPDAFVVMLGTNDYEYKTSNNNVLTEKRPALDQTQFVERYTAFVQSLLTACPNAKVLLCGSPMLTDDYPSSADAQHTSLATNLNSVISNINQPGQIAAIDIPTLADAQRTGCGGHPNRAGHQQLTAKLSTALRALLGW